MNDLTQLSQCNTLLLHTYRLATEQKGKAVTIRETSFALSRRKSPFENSFQAVIGLRDVGFPDSMSMELHSRSSVRDSTFFFRISRVHAINLNETSTSGLPTQELNISNGQRLQHYHNQGKEYIYGYVSVLVNKWH